MITIYVWVFCSRCPTLRIWYDLGVVVIHADFYLFFVLILQPAGRPGDTAAWSTPENSAAPHGIIWPWISGPQGPGWPLWGHPLAHTGLRSAVGQHFCLFACAFGGIFWGCLISQPISSINTRAGLGLDTQCTNAFHFWGRHNFFLADVLHFNVSDYTLVSILRIVWLISRLFLFPLVLHWLDVMFYYPCVTLCISCKVRCILNVDSKTSDFCMSSYTCRIRYLVAAMIIYNMRKNMKKYRIARKCTH